MKRTPLRRIGKRGKAIQSAERKLKAALMKELPVDSYGRQICPNCRQLPDFRGWHLIHIKSKGQCGKTEQSNVFVGCASCHNSFNKAIGGHCIKEIKANPQWGRK